MSHQRVETLQAVRSVRFRKHGAPEDEGNTHARLRPGERGATAAPSPSAHVHSPGAREPPARTGRSVASVGQAERASAGVNPQVLKPGRSGSVRPGRPPPAPPSAGAQSWCTMLSAWLTDTGPSWRRRCHWKVVLREPTSSSSFSCSLANSINTCSKVDWEKL